MFTEIHGFQKPLVKDKFRNENERKKKRLIEMIKNQSMVDYSISMSNIQNRPFSRNLLEILLTTILQ